MSEREISQSMQDKLRQLPAVGKLLESDWAQELQIEHGAGLVRCFLKDHINSLREQLLAGKETDIREDTIRQILARQLAFGFNATNRIAYNATGILLHTGLGRSPLCSAAREAITAASGYTILQTSVETGERSLREEKIEIMLRELTGCEAATVVNNNAAATMLVLNVLCAGKEAVISRGQLIEIGGAFRMPDVMSMSGAIMHEIGTTNRTHLRDYAAAINEETGGLIHVHTSNYRVRGFAGEPDISEIAALAKERGVYSLDDLGSGALIPLEEWGLPNEPLITDSIKAGADLCCFSGDKLIGGPQCGIICGSKELIAKVRKNPFARMFRVCKLTLAALEATLGVWLKGDIRKEIPFYRMLCSNSKKLLDKAVDLAENLYDMFELECRVTQSEAFIGSGSIPDETVPSVAVRIRPSGFSLDNFARELRRHGVFCRLGDGVAILEVLTLLDADMGEVAKLIRSAVDACTGKKDAQHLPDLGVQEAGV